jgi:hypothetical protein
MEPNDLKNSFGINYRYRSFNHLTTEETLITDGSKHAIGNTVLSSTLMQEERFNSYDLWFNYFVNESWQLYATMTFADNYYLEDDSVVHNVSGPGDLSVIMKHLLFNTKVTDSSNWATRIIVGVGFKLPIGKYNQAYMVSPTTTIKGTAVYGSPYPELDPHLQAGTGSLDAIFLSEIQVRYKQFGISTDASYKWNTENSNQFRFANRLNLNSYLFYLYKAKKYSISPNIGINYELSKRDQLLDEKYLNSGGEAIFYTTGLKFYYEKIALGVSYHEILNQNLNDNQLQNKRRITTNLSFYF